MKLAVLLLLVAGGLHATPPRLPANYPAGLYDEERVPAYTLPDPLSTASGQRIATAAMWRGRRTEILDLFAEHIYGRAPVGRPKEMTWTVATGAAASGMRTKTVTLLFAGRSDGPAMTVRLFLPAAGDRVPVFVHVGTGFAPWTPPNDPMAAPEFAAMLLTRGYGLATCDITQLDPDRKDGYAAGIRAYYAGSPAAPRRADAWGTISSWAWALSRALDYLETDRDIDAARVAIVGFSRFGKVAMWAGAQDERFALVCSGLSGCAGATLVRRGYGETVRSITGYAPYWFADNFQAYGDRVGDLPVDWHELIACIAPRPLYLATAEEDYWNDPHGQFLAAVAAEPVYRLLGSPGLGTTTPPPVGRSVGATIAYHRRPGGHGLTSFDWAQFVAFADRQFGRATSPASTLHPPSP